MFFMHAGNRQLEAGLSGEQPANMPEPMEEDEEEQVVERWISWCAPSSSSSEVCVVL